MSCNETIFFFFSLNAISHSFAFFSGQQFCEKSHFHQSDCFSDILKADSRTALFREKGKMLKQQGLHSLLQFSPAPPKTKQERSTEKKKEKEKNAASVSGADCACTLPAQRQQMQQISIRAPQKGIFANSVSLHVLLLAALPNHGLKAVLQRGLAWPSKLCIAGVKGGEGRKMKLEWRKPH